MKAKSKKYKVTKIQTIQRNSKDSSGRIATALIQGIISCRETSCCSKNNMDERRKSNEVHGSPGLYYVYRSRLTRWNNKPFPAVVQPFDEERLTHSPDSCTHFVLLFANRVMSPEGWMSQKKVQNIIR